MVIGDLVQLKGSEDSPIMVISSIDGDGEKVYTDWYCPQTVCFYKGQVFHMETLNPVELDFPSEEDLAEADEEGSHLDMTPTYRVIYDADDEEVYDEDYVGEE